MKLQGSKPLELRRQRIVVQEIERAVKNALKCKRVYFALLASAVWNRFLTAFCLYFCDSVSAVTYVKASSGHHLTHWGSFVSLSVQLLHVNTIFLSGCMFMAP